MSIRPILAMAASFVYDSHGWSFCSLCLTFDAAAEERSSQKLYMNWSSLAGSSIWAQFHVCTTTICQDRRRIEKEGCFFCVIVAGPFVLWHAAVASKQTKDQKNELCIPTHTKDPSVSSPNWDLPPTRPVSDECWEPVFFPKLSANYKTWDYWSKSNWLRAWIWHWISVFFSPQSYLKYHHTYHTNSRWILSCMVPKFIV